MKSLFLTTALLTFGATPLLSETHDIADASQGGQHAESQLQITAANLIGKTLYVGDDDGFATMAHDVVQDVPEHWQAIAAIEDVLIDAQGDLAFIVLSAGWFDGDAETGTSVPAEKLRFVADGDEPGEYYVIYTDGFAALQESGDYNPAALERAGTRSAAGSEADLTPDAVRNRRNPQAEGLEPFSRVSMTRASLAGMTTGDLNGTPLYDDSDNAIGKIDALVLTEDGAVSGVLVDVGAFLGVGARPVLIALPDIELMEAQDGALHGFANLTRTQIEELPAWRGDGSP